MKFIKKSKIINLIIIILIFFNISSAYSINKSLSKPKKNNYKGLVIFSSVVLTVATIILIALYNKKRNSERNRKIESDFDSKASLITSENIVQEKEYHSPYTNFHEAVLNDCYYRDITCLIKNGANIEEKNKEGNTPLAVACKLKLLGMTRLLINNGASINATNNNGRTPLDIMEDNANEEERKERLRPKRSYSTRFGYVIDYSIPYTEPNTKWIDLFKEQSKIKRIKLDAQYAWLHPKLKNKTQLYNPFHESSFPMECKKRKKEKTVDVTIDCGTYLCLAKAIVPDDE